jgi:hypothetical protein
VQVKNRSLNPKLQKPRLWLCPLREVSHNNWCPSKLPSMTLRYVVLLWALPSPRILLKFVISSFRIRVGMQLTYEVKVKILIFLKWLVHRLSPSALITATENGVYVFSAHSPISSQHMFICCPFIITSLYHLYMIV